MGLQFFTIPVREPQSAGELNTFLRSHRVLSIDRRWVEAGDNSFWSVCVDYLETGVPVPLAAGGASFAGKSKLRIDYRETLPADQFALFAKLRDLRKEMAQAEGGPPYAVFTNEHLAQIVQSGATSKADLEKIAGVGDARIEKYGARVLDFLAVYRQDTSRKAPHATDGQPV